MAVAGGGIPCFKVQLDRTAWRVQVFGWATNKPAHLVERDLERALARLLAGEAFELFCSGPQVMTLNAMLASLGPQVHDSSAVHSEPRDNDI